jgi:uncharacterized membrane protein YedE/YeeE
MTFTSFAAAQSSLLLAVFIISVVLGAVVNKTNFCTMGAVSDWVNMGDKGRFRAWLLAIAVAMLGVVVLESLGVLRIGSSFPPYRAGQLIWAENLLGGIVFGIGMTLASGCGNKTLIRIGGGNIKSILVLFVIAVIAYYMINPLPGTDQTLYSLLFYPWLRPLAVNAGSAQDLGTLFAGPEKAVTARLIIGGVLGALLLIYIFKAADFRSSLDNILGGVVVGLAVLAAWYVTSNLQIDADGELLSLPAYYEQWDMLTDTNEGKPAQAAPLSTQSYTFINPMAQTFGYAKAGMPKSLLTFGVVALMGVILGSFLWSVLTRRFRIEWFASFRDFLNHLIGAILMAIGGVIAVGCTIGQGVTGISTLAVGSFIAFVGIVFGSALTMKIQYYQLVYEDEASFPKALITSLVDMKLLPNSMRQLDAV